MKTTHRKTRTGAATLEFVIALPILTALMVAMTWAGFSVLYKA